MNPASRIRPFLLASSIFWCITVLLAWVLIALLIQHTQVEHNAARQARNIIENALGFRAWVSSHGGVYIPATDSTPPNPHLSHIPGRDLALGDGQLLTLMNPAYALRDLQSRFTDLFGISTHLSSLRPLHSKNTPEPWEQQALEAFEAGTPEFSEVISLDNQKYLRLMRPLHTEKSCLKCHSQHGYQEDDIQGGISITLPLSEFLREARHLQIYGAIALFCLWLFGQTGLWFFNRRIITLLRARDEAYLQLAAHKDELENKIKERTLSLEDVNHCLEKEVEERARTQAALEESHSELQQIFNSAADGFRIIDWHYNMIKFNNTFARMVGCDPVELHGRKCYEVFPGPFCHTEECPLAKARRGEESIQEVRKTNLLGKVIDCLDQSAIFHDTNGRPMGILESLRDISRLKELEKQLAEEAACNAKQAVDLQQKNTDVLSQNIMLEQALADLKATQSQMLQSEKMAAVGQLAAGVAHEINNPTGFVTSNLASLQKYIQRITEFLALLEGAVPAERQQEIADVRRSMKINQINDDIHDLIAESLAGTERIRKIVMSLKNFSRQDQEEYGPANLNDCLDTTLNVIWNELKYKATVTREYGDLPHTHCYAQQLNQVFMNLLINAGQAIADQGEITVRTWSDKEKIFITISDTGSGMDEQTLSHLFEPFFTTKDKDKGTGLGLSIAYDIITKKHHGAIHVASRPGEGSTFTIELPIVSE